VRFNDTGSFGVWIYAGLNYHDDPTYVDDTYPEGKPFISEEKA
jgi:hypothetical protein